MNKAIYDVINKALNLWIDATGVDPMQMSWSMGEFGVYKSNQTIRESQDLDHTALTTFMVLRSEARKFAESREFNALEFLENPDDVLKRTEKLRRLLSILNTPECLAEVKAFQGDLKAMAKATDLDGIFGDLIDEVQELAYIRRDALRGFKTLQIHHFSAGKRGSSKPKYNPIIAKFWNMNSVVRFAEVQPEDGISMVMVRDPVDLHSYFCFLVKNGENIAIYSDIPDDPHPLHKYMSRARAQERRYEDRAFRLRFPYQLFDFEFTDDGKYRGEKAKSALSPVNIQAVRVKPIRELEKDQALWAMMMFDLLAQEHWREEPKPLTLSYLGEGMVAALPAPKAKGALIAPGFAAVKELTGADMAREKLAHVFERKPTGQNDWLEDRYKDKVPNQVYNLIGGGKVYRLLDGTKAKPGKLVPKNWAPDGQIANTNAIIHSKNTDLSLVAVDPTSFGTPEKMESDRRWIARYNEACVIQAEANREFDARKDEVTAWYREHVEANLPRLLKAAALGTFKSEIQGRSTEDSFDSSFDHGAPKKGEILFQWTKKSFPWRHTRDMVRLFRHPEGREDAYCWLSGETASVWTYFHPWTPVSLADLAGCKVKDLPDVLQHWYRNDRYSGNSILNRLDPMDWKLENPWRSLHFEVILGLSKHSFNKICKDHGVTRRTPKPNDED